MKTKELDKQIASLYRQLADLHEQRATVEDDLPQPTTAQSGVALGAMLGVHPRTIARRAKDGKPLLGYHVEHVSDRLFRLVPITATKLAPPKEREGLRRMRIVQSLTS